MILGVIPARMGSSRFPGKPMELIHGIPMIGHCIIRASMCEQLDDVVVATCDQVIYEYIESIGFKCIMTDDKHERASDRVAEAMLQYESLNGREVVICVMLQGDEPMTTPITIGKAVSKIKDNKYIHVVNIYSEITSLQDVNSPNVVKVVPSAKETALYFSREPIPSDALYEPTFKRYKQICVIPFRRDYLLEYMELTPTLNEIIESIDMNRVLDHGELVHLVYSDELNFPVDTPSDIKKVEKAMIGDPLLTKYVF